jgi:hypothetical protein
MAGNRIELLRSLYRAGQELRAEMKSWRQCVTQAGHGDVAQQAGHGDVAQSPQSAMAKAIIKVEQATEAIAETGMFEPVSDAVAAQRLKDALAGDGPEEQEIAIISYATPAVDAHDGAGYYWHSAEYPEEGACGAFATEEKARRSAEQHGYRPHSAQAAASKARS